MRIESATLSAEKSAKVTQDRGDRPSPARRERRERPALGARLADLQIGVHAAHEVAGHVAEAGRSGPGVSWTSRSRSPPGCPGSSEPASSARAPPRDGQAVGAHRQPARRSALTTMNSCASGPRFETTKSTLPAARSWRFAVILKSRSLTGTTVPLGFAACPEDAQPLTTTTRGDQYRRGSEPSGTGPGHPDEPHAFPIVAVRAKPLPAPSAHAPSVQAPDVGQRARSMTSGPQRGLDRGTRPVGLAARAARRCRVQRAWKRSPCSRTQRSSGWTLVPHPRQRPMLGSPNETSLTRRPSFGRPSVIT